MQTLVRKIEVFEDRSGKQHATFDEALKADQVLVLAELMDNSLGDRHWDEVTLTTLAEKMIENSKQVVIILSQKPHVTVVSGLVGNDADDGNIDSDDLETF